MEALVFYPFALVAVISAILVIWCRNPVNSALSLVLTFICLAGLYVTLNAPFMAAIQIIVYAGAIMVLILFVIMMLNLSSDVKRGIRHSVVTGPVASGLILFFVLYFVGGGEAGLHNGTLLAEIVNKVGHTEMIGAAIFTQFLFPFEIASILLLVAIIGAVVLAKKDV